MSIDQIFDVCFLCCFEWSSQISGTKKRMFRWHGSCSTCFIKTGNPVFPVKSKVSNPSCNVFHFPPCFPIKPWTGWKNDWWMWMMHFHNIGNDFLFLHVQPCLWKNWRGKYWKHQYTYIGATPPHCRLIWGYNSFIYTLILVLREYLRESNIPATHKQGVVASGKMDV